MDFERDILPGLQGVRAGKIQKATGLSIRYAYEIRNDEKVPKLQYWPILVGLASL